MYYRILQNTSGAIFISGSIIMLIVLSSLTAYAHRINLFCKVENQEIVCSSNYADGKAVKNAQIRVLSQKEYKLLLKGKTNENGTVRFDISPELKQKNPDLKISVQESMGHRDTWIINAEEYAKTLKDNTKESTKSQPQNDGKFAANASNTNTETENISIKKQEFKKLLADTISSELGPLESKIESVLQYKQNQSFRDILGGIGYILGIMGIVFFIKGRNKR